MTNTNNTSEKKCADAGSNFLAVTLKQCSRHLKSAEMEKQANLTVPR